MVEYLDWRVKRYPTTTDSHREYLYKFAVACGKGSVQQINREDVEGFVNAFSGEYHKQSSSKVVFSFLAFHGMGEWDEVEKTADEAVKKKVGRPANLRLIKRVKDLKNRQHMSFRLIQRQLLDEEERRYELSQLHHWYHHRE